jgi:hypothetical protein
MSSEMNAPETVRTPITDMFGIKYPILLAGMNVAAGPELAAVVTNNGGLGVIGGIGYTPKMLRENINELKAHLTDKNAPFGVDLLLPQVGGSARKTNYDYSKVLSLHECNQSAYGDGRLLSLPFPERFLFPPTGPAPRADRHHR